MKLQEIEPGILMFHCPGCRFGHPFHTDARKHPRGEVWTWNGSFDKPTFSPSLLVNGHDPRYRCHLYLRDGQIHYLVECFHHLAGQTVDLVDMSN